MALVFFGILKLCFSLLVILFVILMFLFLVNSFTFCFIGFYGNPKIDLKKHSWDLLRLLYFLSILHWLVARDSNEILFPDEKIGRDRNT